MVVRMRHTRAHTANRRSHHFLKGARFETCAKCKEQHLMHRACPNCGTYRNRVVLDVAKKAMRKAKKAESKSEAKSSKAAPKETAKK